MKTIRVEFADSVQLTLPAAPEGAALIDMREALLSGPHGKRQLVIHADGDELAKSASYRLTIQRLSALSHAHGYLATVDAEAMAPAALEPADGDSRLTQSGCESSAFGAVSAAA